MDKVVLTTDRLSLREMTRDHLSNLMEIFSDPEAMKYYPSTLDEQEALAWIERMVNNYQRYGVGLWVVEERATGRFLGQCGIIPQELDGSTVMEIGYLFVRQEWGHGYATEAARACMEYGFHELQYPKLVSFIDVHNIPSANVAKRNGMNIEQTIVKWDKQVWVYAITRDAFVR